MVDYRRVTSRGQCWVLLISRFSLQELGHSVKRDQRAEDGKYLGPFADISGGPDTPGLVVEVTRYERSV